MIAGPETSKDCTSIRKEKKQTAIKRNTPIVVIALTFAIPKA
jgi:hypothetical protein